MKNNNKKRPRKKYFTPLSDETLSRDNLKNFPQILQLQIRPQRNKKLCKV